MTIELYNNRPQDSSILISNLRTKIHQELLLMAEILNTSTNEYPFNIIEQDFNASINLIERSLKFQQIDPSVSICVSPAELSVPAINRVLRIGFYPVSANPFHWGHLLIGLSAMARFGLDKVIYVIAWNDPQKSSLISAEIRHLMGQEVLKPFRPFFEYSAIARDTDYDGETNLFKMLKLNPHQKIDAFYMVGADHCYRFNPHTNRKDTIQKLEDHINHEVHGFNELMHSVSLIFTERGEREETDFDSTLHLEFMPQLNFEVSSTLIREAFQNKQNRQCLAFLPYDAFEYIYTLSLYGRSPLDAGMIRADQRQEFLKSLLKEK